MILRNLFERLRVRAEKLPGVFKTLPHPWLQPMIATIALTASVISATFAGLTYFKTSKARATIVVDRFDERAGKVQFPGQGEKTTHTLRMWINNTGQSAAVLRNVTVSAELYDQLLTPEKESQRMDSALSNRATIGIELRNAEVVTGQKVFYPSRSGYPDDLWQQFKNGKQYLYVFAVILFSDELSGGHEIRTEVCVQIDQSLNNWNHCSAGRNRTIRPN